METWVESDPRAGRLEPEEEVGVFSEVQLPARVVEALVESADGSERGRAKRDVATEVGAARANLGRVGERPRARPRFDPAFDGIERTGVRDLEQPLEPSGSRNLVRVEESHPVGLNVLERTVARTARPAVS